MRVPCVHGYAHFLTLSDFGVLLVRACVFATPILTDAPPPAPPNTHTSTPFTPTHQANTDHASPLPDPGHLFVPHAGLSRECRAVGGTPHFLPMWKDARWTSSLLKAGVKQAAFWYSHVCKLA